MAWQVEASKANYARYCKAVARWIRQRVSDNSIPTRHKRPRYPLSITLSWVDALIKFFFLPLWKLLWKLEFMKADIFSSADPVPHHAFHLLMYSQTLSPSPKTNKIRLKLSLFPPLCCWLLEPWVSCIRMKMEKRKKVLWPWWMPSSEGFVFSSLR